jgi:hypothetical protein
MVNPKLQQEQDRIAQLAHELWEQEGRPEGRALEHWLQAESRLQSNPRSSGSSVQPQVGTPTAAAQPALPAAKSNGSNNGSSRSKAPKRARV